MRSVGGPILGVMAFLVGALGFGASSHGHALQPGYLELRLIDKDLYAIVWKIPATGAQPMAIAAQLPESCGPRTPVQPIWDGAAYVARWTANCPGGLEGGAIRSGSIEPGRTCWSGSTSPTVLAKLHGFGFAGALAGVGLPQNSIPIALLFFNVGVEIGQLLFIASVFVTIALARRIVRRVNVPRPAWAWAVPPYAIGSLAVFWVIQRTAAF